MNATLQLPDHPALGFSSLGFVSFYQFGWLTAQ